MTILIQVHASQQTQHAPSATAEASSVRHETSKSSSRRRPCTNAHLGVNHCQMSHAVGHFPPLPAIRQETNVGCH